MIVEATGSDGAGGMTVNACDAGDVLISSAASLRPRLRLA